ncbi:MAG: AMP-binding protein [Acidobacteriota bacterium]
MDTLGELVSRLRRIAGGHRAWLSIRRGDQRDTWSGTDLIDDVHALALALDEAGLVKGDRLALFASHRPEWLIADLACQVLGLVTVPLNPDLGTAEAARILRNSHSKWVVVDGVERRARLTEIAPTLAHSPTVLALDAADAVAGDRVLTELLGWGAGRRATIPLERFRDRAALDDLASMHYARADDEPAGREVSHREAIEWIMWLARQLNLSGDDRLLMAPSLAEPIHSMLALACLAHGSALRFVAEDGDVASDLTRETATILAGSTSFYVRLRNALHDHLRDRETPFRGLKRRALESAVRHRERRRTGRLAVVHGRWVRWVLDPLVLRSVRSTVFGGAVRLLVCTGGAMNPAAENLFAALRLPILDLPELGTSTPVVDVG